LLYAIYEEEGYTPSQIPSTILTNNLYGTEIDPRAGALAAFALTMKATAKRKLFPKNPVEPNICVLDAISFSADELSYLVTKDGERHAEEGFWNQFAEADTFGSLIQPDSDRTVRLAGYLATLDDGGDILRADTLDRAGRVITQAEYLLPRYSVAIANPPYMGGKNMGTSLASFAKENYPKSKSDLFAMFIERCVGLCRERGLVAMITMQSWMFLASFGRLRARIVEKNPPLAMLHLGTRGFDSIGGDVVSTTAFILKRSGDPQCSGVYVRAVAGLNEAAKCAALRDATRDSDCDWRYEASASNFTKIPGAPIAYWLSVEMLEAFSKGAPLATVSSPRNGLQTSDN